RRTPTNGCACTSRTSGRGTPRPAGCERRASSPLPSSTRTGAQRAASRSLIPMDARWSSRRSSTGPMSRVLPGMALEPPPGVTIGLIDQTKDHRAFPIERTGTAVSHHFDSPTALEDGRLNLSHLYAFPGPGDTTNLILTVNPDAGRSSPATLRPDAQYEFVIASDGGTIEDRAIRMRADGPDQNGRQRMVVRLAVGPEGRHGVDRRDLGSGCTDETFALAGGGSAWFGVVSDPFWGDGFA